MIGQHKWTVVLGLAFYSLTFLGLPTEALTPLPLIRVDIPFLTKFWLSEFQATNELPKIEGLKVFHERGAGKGGKGTFGCSFVNGGLQTSAN